MMEAIVVASIFTTLMTGIMDVYMTAGRAGGQVISRSKLQADARSSLEAISRAIRVSNFDYASYGGVLPAQPTSDLRLINPTTSEISRIGLGAADANCYSDGKSFPCLRVSTDGGTTWTPLSAKGSKIDAFNVYMSPARDPFAFDSVLGIFTNDATNTTRQPVATLVIKFHGVAARASDEWVYTLQTSVTPRLYVR